MERHYQQFPPDASDAERAVEVLRAIAEPTRLRIVLLLSGGERSVGEIVDAVGAPQSTVSRHLSYLRRTRLVRARRSGTTQFYSLGNAHVGHIVLETLSFGEHEHLRLPDHPAADVESVHLHEHHWSNK